MTKGHWCGEPFELIDWQEQIIRDLFGVVRKFDEYRQFKTAYVEIPKKQGKSELVSDVWVYFRQLSGKEFYAAAAVQATEEVLFTIGYRTDITTANFIRFRGVDYDITRIDTFEGYKADLTLYCKRKTWGIRKLRIPTLPFLYWFIILYLFIF